MPKLNRAQRFAVLKNIFAELGEKAVMRHAARLQVPAEDARSLIAEWKGSPPGGAALDYQPEQVVRLERRVRQAPKRKARPVKRKPRPLSAVAASAPTKVIKLGEAALPPEKETGEDWVEGYKGAMLRKGTHVRYEPDGTAVGVITFLGKQQSEVKWFRTGATQAEANGNLRRAHD